MTNHDYRSWPRPTRRSVLAGSIAAAALSLPLAQTSGAQTGEGFATGLLIRADGPGAGLALHNPVSGEELVSFATDGRPESAWATPRPGVAMVRTDKALALADCIAGQTLPVAIPATVAPQILSKSIQFRGSRGTLKMLVGTPNYGAETYVVDLVTLERTAVIGLITATPPPASLQNVQLAPDDRHLLAWDGRRTWLIDLETRASELIGTGEFTFSGGFSSDGELLIYSQQLASGSTEIREHRLDGTFSSLITGGSDILVSLPLPGRNVILIDKRTDDGGEFRLRDLDSIDSIDLLEYTGATNIVQLTPDGQFALVSIEGEAGRDWYRLTLDLEEGGALLFDELADAEVAPGFDFDAEWAVATTGASDLKTGTIYAVDLIAGETTAMVEGITTDAEVSKAEVAPNGPGALLSIDSFTEFSVKFLDLAIGEDRTIGLMKGGHGVLSPAGNAFAVTFDLNTGGTATIVYDADGQEVTTIPGAALTWI